MFVNAEFFQSSNEGDFSIKPFRLKILVFNDDTHFQTFLFLQKTKQCEGIRHNMKYFLISD